MNNNLTQTMNTINALETLQPLNLQAAQTEKPWWFVRPALLATLTVLVTLLVTLLARPEIIDRMNLAGL